MMKKVTYLLVLLFTVAILTACDYSAQLKDEGMLEDGYIKYIASKKQLHENDIKNGNIEDKLKYASFIKIYEDSETLCQYFRRTGEAGYTPYLNAYGQVKGCKYVNVNSIFENHTIEEVATLLELVDTKYKDVEKMDDVVKILVENYDYPNTDLKDILNKLKNKK